MPVAKSKWRSHWTFPPSANLFKWNFNAFLTVFNAFELYSGQVQLVEAKCVRAASTCQICAQKEQPINISKTNRCFDAESSMLGCRLLSALYRKGQGRAAGFKGGRSRLSRLSRHWLSLVKRRSDEACFTYERTVPAPNLASGAAPRPERRLSGVAANALPLAHVGSVGPSGSFPEMVGASAGDGGEVRL